MILVLGGTTEGRKAIETLDKAGKTFFYSTISDMQEVSSRNAVRVTGGLDEEEMIDFCISKGIKAIVDAAHPFAIRLHETVATCSQKLSIPVVRFERKYPTRDNRLTWCDDYDDAVRKMLSDNVSCLLALTGVKTISSLKGYWEIQDCYFRILDRDESRDIARIAGFPEEKLIYYKNDGDITNIINYVKPDAIITKESGESGGFSTKVEEALQSGLKVYVVSRPKLPSGFHTVTGEYGLRKAVEKFVPGYYDLRSGFTTGACATAAAKAALLTLVTDEDVDIISFSIPDGEDMCIKTAGSRLIDDKTAEASVIKDAGDDPDVTDGCEVKARVCLTTTGVVRFFGGEGIGTVTLPGVGLEIGEPAINPVPRQMIRDELSKIYPGGCDVTISVPGGDELAKKTFNSRIGIEGGISIIGTSGIVMPFSNEAFMDAIRREMEVAKASGCERVVLNSGARSENVVRSFYPNLPKAAFIHYGNAIGESLDLAQHLGIERLTVGIMIGKAVKLAEGNTDTHSHKVTINREFLSKVAADAKCSEDAVRIMQSLNMARELWSLLSEEDGEKFFPYLLSLCMRVCREKFIEGDLTLMLISDNGEISAMIC